jgi:SAM-dependent methyltransferase
MEAFYELATQDYAELVAAHDWPAELITRSRGGTVRLLDVACGSGRFPSALLAAGLATDVGELTVMVDLLDPSPFSLAEARTVLRPPFQAAAELQIGLEDLDTDRAPYDVAWATHALYAVAPGRLPDGLRRMHASLRPGGFGAVAHATAASHYLAVQSAYRAAHAPEVTPFTAAEAVVDGLTAAGADVAVRTVRYRTGTDDAAVAEGFLQRCLFDDTLTLAAMTSPGPYGDELVRYLDACRDGDRWRFDHEVHLMTWESAP